MVACQLLFFLWVMYAMIDIKEEDFIPFYTCFAWIGWALFGSLMVGEDHLLSPKIRRSLPTTLFGRVYLTLFSPGPGTGYLFAIANMLTVFIACCFLAGYVSNHKDVPDYLCAAWTAVCYTVIYLGITRLLLRWMSRRSSTGPILGAVVCVVLVGISALFAMIAQFALWDDDYTLLQLPNVFWTFAEVADGRTFMQPLIVLSLSIFAGVIFLINMRTMSSRLIITQTVVPDRVVEDEELLNPTPAAPHLKSSPWDDEE